MVIVGAKGHAKEVLAVLEDNQYSGEIFFFDDVSKDLPDLVYGKYPVITSLSDAEQALAQDRTFILGTGKPAIRKKLFDIFNAIAEPVSLISRTATIGQHEVVMGKGLNIMFQAFISNSTSVSEGVLVNSGVYVHHDVSVGPFCELAPGVKLLGGAKVGAYSFVGANAVVLPGVKVGNNVVIGAGAIVNKDIPDGVVAVGAPAKILEGKIDEE